jgi:hypothetical protein
MKDVVEDVEEEDRDWSRAICGLASALDGTISLICMID